MSKVFGVVRLPWLAPLVVVATNVACTHSLDAFDNLGGTASDGSVSDANVIGDSSGSDDVGSSTDVGAADTTTSDSPVGSCSGMTAPTCFTCCQDKVVGGWAAYVEAEKSCICDSTTCFGNGGAGRCKDWQACKAGGSALPSATCFTCMDDQRNNVTTVTCATAKTTCVANAECNAFLQCVNSCMGR